MAPSLRKRLGMRSVNASAKDSATGHDGASASMGGSSDDMNATLTTDTQDQQPLTQDDASANPPPIPDRELRSAKKTTSPPQFTLDRYKKGMLKATVETAITNTTYKAGKSTAFSELFGDDSSATSSKWVGYGVQVILRLHPIRQIHTLMDCMLTLG